MSSISSSGLMEVAPGIYRSRVLTAPECAQLIAAMEAACAWQLAHVSDATGEGVALASVRNAEALREGSMDCSRIRAVLEPTLREMADLIDEPLTLSPLDLVRYPLGGEYRVHTDFGPATFRRVYTALVYLNDDFSGGETAFPDLEYAAVPRTGSLLLFPSYYRHCGKPVQGARKYIAVGWMLARELSPWILNPEPPSARRSDFAS